MNESDRPIVFLSGASGVGKSSLARKLSASLGLPMLSLDTIKESLADGLGSPGTPSPDWLDAASLRVLVAIARQWPGGVVDAYWRPSTRWAIDALGTRTAEVLCQCPGTILRSRLQDRRRDRHPVHRDAADVPFIEDILADAISFKPITAGPVLRVDTSAPVDVHTIASWAAAALEFPMTPRL